LSARFKPKVAEFVVLFLFPAAFASSSLFRCLERVDLGICGLNFDAAVGGKIANFLIPLLLGGGSYGADASDAAVDNPLASFALFNDRLTAVTIKDTALLGPKSTLGPGLDSLTLHESSPSFLVMFRRFLLYTGTSKFIPFA